MRNCIVVTENGSIVKYFRENPEQQPKSTPKIKPKSKPKREEPKLNVHEDRKLSQCRVVCHNMSRRDIEAKIKEVENRNVDVDNVVDLFGQDWFGETKNKQQQERNLTQNQLELNGDWIKIVIANNTFYFTLVALKSMLLRFVSTFTDFVNTANENHDMKRLMDDGNKTFGYSVDSSVQVSWENCFFFLVRQIAIVYIRVF